VLHRDEAVAVQDIGVGSEADDRGGARKDLLQPPADHLRGVDIDYVLVPKPNSIALRMAMVAADEADAVASIRWGAEWDIAAACLIAQEAGAMVTDVLGRPFRFNRPDPRALGILCTVPQIHAAGVARLHDRAVAVLGEGQP
jgi:myo-inositol-1(or 4)-monophosphatase